MATTVEDFSPQAALRPVMTSHQLPVHQNPTLNPGNRQQQQQQQQQQQPSFGICFDVDGVLLNGTVPIPAAAKAIAKLLGDDGQPRIPINFVTNSLNRPTDRANQLSRTLGIQVSKQQIIQAPSPLSVFGSIQDKFCLVVGQDNVLEIAADLGFRWTCTVEDVAAAYPLLDMVDHENRRKVSKFGYEEKPLQRIEAIVLMGEPKRWESALQIIVDLLRTDGQPRKDNEIVSVVKQLPVIACNMDLQFKDRALSPRFGHGAFLVCLEALYKKITGADLQYASLVGKPSEITFRFAEHILTKESLRMGHNVPIKTMYLVGDTPEVDIAGCNLYQRYVDRFKRLRHHNGNGYDTGSLSTSNGIPMEEDATLPGCRGIPEDAEFSAQTVERVVALLVCTGVYVPRPEQDQEDNPGSAHGHRDFPSGAELNRPARVCRDVEEAVDYILESENFKF